MVFLKNIVQYKIEIITFFGMKSNYGAYSISNIYSACNIGWKNLKICLSLFVGNPFQKIGEGVGKYSRGGWEYILEGVGKFCSGCRDFVRGVGEFCSRGR